MQPTERLINLIAFLLDARQPATADDIRELVAGYDPKQSHDAFQRMFERDKDDLRELGVPLVVAENENGDAAYSIDRRSYYLPPIDVGYEEALALRLAATLLASDPGYPLGEEITTALAKLACDCDPPGIKRPNLTVRLAPEALEEKQSANLAALREAIDRTKTATFTYHSMSSDATETRTLEPYGLYNSNGHWYVVGRCGSAQALRTFRLSRIRDAVIINAKRPKAADFRIPEDFRLGDHLRQSWQLGEHRFEAAVRFDRSLAPWARRTLTRAVSMSDGKDGSVTAVLSCGDEKAILRWVLSFGAGAEILEPPVLRALAAERLSATMAQYEEARQ